MARNYVNQQHPRTTMRATIRHQALGEEGAITVIIEHTTPLLGRLVDRIRSDVARHMRLEPAPAGYSSRGFECIDGKDEPADERQAEASTGEPASRMTASPSARRKTAAERAAEEV